MTDYVSHYTSPKAEWQKREADRVAHQLKTETIIRSGVLRWKSSNNVPPDDYLEFADFLGIQFDLKISLKVQKDEQLRAIRDYKSRQASRSPQDIEEERMMASAAHGPGVELVNVITGVKFKT